ncbi:trimethylamine methyltransferase family protein [bacterium]|nr:trimethylamine methyltransferase family protein [bacterium]
MHLLTHTMSVLNEPEMEQIWQAALRVWARVPLRVQAPEEFLQPLRDLGCTIDGERVSFPEPVRDLVLGRIEQSRQERGPCRPAEVTTNELSYAASGQALVCCDLETEALRPATTADLAQWSRICDHFPRLGRAHPTFIPQDVPPQICDLHTFATNLLNSKRATTVSVYNADLLPYFLELQAISSGSPEQAKRAPAFVAKCWVNTPFMITRENVEVGLKARELLGQPFNMMTMPVAGTATPVTLAGALVQCTAEVLACNVISLALDDRLIGWIAHPCPFDMKVGIHTQSGPDMDLLALGARQMGAYVFGGEFHGFGGPGTASKRPDAQAVMEKALSCMWGICGGVRGWGSLGVTAFSDIGSVTQLMLDLELMGYFERLLQGIAVGAEKLAEEVICEIAPKGAYFLNQDHTARHFREELWLPELVDRRVPMAWAQDPRTMIDNARAKARRVAAEAENQCPLTDEEKRAVEAVVAEARRQIGV